MNRKGNNLKFYVFYKEDDTVRCCGTAQDLVEAGYFKNRASVVTTAARVKAGQRRGHVVILPMNEEEESIPLF